ncbi:MAG: hypothetical protein ACRDWD_12945 [Acidimicrobiia bacterium]
MGRTSRGPIVVGTIVVSVLALVGCGDGNDPPSPRKQAISACVKSDPTLDRGSCACLVDKLGLTADEVEDLDKLADRDVLDPNAEIERILGKRRADILLSTSAECDA